MSNICHPPAIFSYTAWHKYYYKTDTLSHSIYNGEIFEITKFTKVYISLTLTSASSCGGLGGKCKTMLTEIQDLEGVQKRCPEKMSYLWGPTLKKNTLTSVNVP